ncbi:hypothetical protein PK28_16450 [Hymenobacter sp. DG25B]|nr:hypothetical protein PK28_16450 [Hymenobacter sp. DG25B]
MRPLISWRARLVRLLLALGGGASAFWWAPSDFPLNTQLMLAWDGFIVSTLLLTWYTMARANTAYIRRASTLLHPDRTRFLMLFTTLLGTTASLAAVLLLLRGLEAMSYEERVEHILVSVVAVVTSWLLLHTLFALRYAHTYFSKSLLPPHGQLGGLVFSGEPPTTYWDFAYFSFVIGMTAQTSDTGVSTLRMRQLVLYHSLLSFSFNTAVLALSINILSGLL